MFKRLSILLALILLVSCTKNVDVRDNKINEESKVENTNEEIEQKEETTVEIIEEPKEDLYTFVRPIFTNPTGTKWEITATESCTINFDDYAPWVKNNIEYLVETNEKTQNLNSMVDLVETYKNNGEIKWDHTEKRLYKDGAIFNLYTTLHYIKAFRPAGEIKVLNKSFLDSIDYTDIYCLTIKSMKPYFKEDISYESTGVSWYSPTTKDFYGDFDTRDYFICDLENNGKAYFCRFIDPSVETPMSWAQLENNCLIEVMNTSPIYGIMNPLYLTCPVGYLHRITSTDELQNWAYLYSSAFNKYIDADKIPNANEKSVEQPTVTNRSYVMGTSNASHTYFSMNGGNSVYSGRFIPKQYYHIFDDYFVNYECIKKENHNSLIDEWINKFPVPYDPDYPYEWQLCGTYGSNGEVLIPDTYILYQQLPEYQYTIKFDDYKYKNDILAALGTFGIKYTQHSIDDYGNTSITAEVENYVKSKDDPTFKKTICNAKQYYKISQ